MKKNIVTPKLLSGLAVVGVLVTIFVVAKETPKANKAYKDEFNEEDYPSEERTLKVSARKIARVAWQYKGTILAGSATIGFIIGAQKLNDKELVAAAATIGYLATNRDRAEKWIADEVNEDAYPNYFHEKVYMEDLDFSPDKNSLKLLPIEDTGNGHDLFRETYTGRWFWSNPDAVYQAARRVEDRLDQGELLSYNDVYNEFGLLSTIHGKTIGLNRKLMEISDYSDGIFYFNNIHTEGHVPYTRIDIEPGCLPCSLFRDV